VRVGGDLGIGGGQGAAHRGDHPGVRGRAEGVLQPVDVADGALIVGGVVAVVARVPGVVVPVQHGGPAQVAEVAVGLSGGAVVVVVGDLAHRAPGAAVDLPAQRHVGQQAGVRVGGGEVAVQVGLRRDGAGDRGAAPDLARLAVVGAAADVRHGVGSLFSYNGSEKAPDPFFFVKHLIRRALTVSQPRGGSEAYCV